MKIGVEVFVNMNTKQVAKNVTESTRLGLRDTVVAIHNDAVRLSPVLTGHNRRSIASEVSGMGVVIQGADAETQKIVDDSKLEGAVYSTSGYGGYLETGTSKMGAQPYFKPALDKNVRGLGKAIKGHIE